MDANKQYRFRLDEETYKYIDEFAISNKISRESPALALEKIVREHREFSNKNFNAFFVAEVVSKEVKSSIQIAINESLENEINKIRLGTNNIDRNTQILIELVQGSMQMENLEHIMTTDRNMPPFLTYVQELIQSRITDSKQRKDNQQKKGEIHDDGIE